MKGLLMVSKSLISLVAFALLLLYTACSTSPESFEIKRVEKDSEIQYIHFSIDDCISISL